MTKTKAEIAEWIRMCLEENTKDLTKWEQSFVESLDDQLTRNGSISSRQEEILERIYAEKT